MKPYQRCFICLWFGIVIIAFVILFGGCAHSKPSPSHQLVIPPECFQSMSCKGDIVVRDGHAYCGTWALKYTCVKVVTR